MGFGKRMEDEEETSEINCGVCIVLYSIHLLGLPWPSRPIILEMNEQFRSQRQRFT